MADNNDAFGMIRKLSLSANTLRQFTTQSMQTIKGYIDDGWDVSSIEFVDNAWMWTFTKGVKKVEYTYTSVPTVAKSNAKRRKLPESNEVAENVVALGWAYSRDLRFVYTWWSNGTTTRLPIATYKPDEFSTFAVILPSKQQRLGFRAHNLTDFCEFHSFEGLLSA